MIDSIKVWLTVIVMFLVIGLGMSACHRIGPGYCGVVVNMMDKTNDISETPLPTGITFLAPWKSVYKYPLFEQNVRWEDKKAFSFQTSEGQVVWADMGVTFNVDAVNAPKLLRKYRSGLKEIAQKFIRNYIRDALNIEASKRKVEDLYSVGKEQFLIDVQTKVMETLDPLGIHVSRVYILGQFNLPAGITKALNQKMEAGQRAEQRRTEIDEAKAQAQKTIAEADGAAQSELLKAKARANARLIEAKAEAEANKVVALSLTPELIKYHTLEVWDGKLPQVHGEGSMPFIKLD